MDRLDIRILSLLLEDGRMTKTQIAERIGLSITPCCERIRRLEKRGIVRGYHADLNLTEMLGHSRFRVQIILSNYSLERARQFEKLIRDIPEVLECQAVLGDVDYQLLFTAKDMDHYQQLIENLQESVDGGFDYRSYPISKAVKEQSAASGRLLLQSLEN